MPKPEKTNPDARVYVGNIGLSILTTTYLPIAPQSLSVDFVIKWGGHCLEKLIPRTIQGSPEFGGGLDRWSLLACLYLLKETPTDIGFFRERLLSEFQRSA